MNILFHLKNPNKSEKQSQENVLYLTRKRKKKQA